MQTPQSCGVFISYSHDSPEHQDRVLAFASRLVSEGINVTLDQWVINPDGGWPLWTESQIGKADFVLLVCTDTYRQRVEHPEETPEGAGAFWEANLIRRRLYDGKGVNDRFVPVFFGATGSAAIPEMLEGYSYYQIDSPVGYTALYRRLTGQPEVERPELGKLVVLPRKDPIEASAKEATRPAENESSLTSPVSFTKLTPLPPGDEKQLRSLEGAESTFIRFDNYLSVPVTLYWLNYEGARVRYAPVAPGRSYLQETYVTHPWLVSKGEGSGAEEPVAIFQPAAEAGVAEIR